MGEFIVTSLVRVKTKYQITIPTQLRKKAAIRIGDFLEANIEKGKIIFTPKTIIDRGITESIKDFENGRVYGPFASSEKMITELHHKTKTLEKP